MTAQHKSASTINPLRCDGPVARLCHLTLSVLDADRIELETGTARFSCDAAGHWSAIPAGGFDTERQAEVRRSVVVRRALGQPIGTLSCLPRSGGALGPTAMAHLERSAGLVAELIEHDRGINIAARSLRRERRSRQLLRLQAQELWRRQAIFEQTEQMAKVGGWTSDLRTNEMTWTDEIYRISELPIGKAVSVERALSFYVPEAREKLERAILRTLRDHTPFDLELQYVTALGNPRWVRAMGQAEVHDGPPTRVFGTFQDVTDKKLNETRIWHAAHHDPLTGLPNRKLFTERNTACLAEAARGSASAALLLIDLDDFKLVNDTHGHDAGDAVLQVQAGRLRAALRERDFVARLGGDEFAVLLVDIEDSRDAEAIGERILSAMREPISWDGATLECKGSIGIAIFPEHGRGRSQLFKSADLALYKAKADGRNSCFLYAPSLSRERERRIEVLGHVRTALATDRIVPFYQPVIEIESGCVSGFEALLRWVHPTKGLQLPGTIASAFNDPEVGCALGDRMRLCVMRDMARWRDAGIAFGRIGINVAEPEFQRGDLGERILSDLDRHGLSAQQLVVEVTENALLSRSADRARDALQTLREAGIHVALDDFGTGASSLTHLQKLPVGALKIDRSFVAGVLTDRRSAAIVSAIIALSRQLQFDMIAEGVESEEQLAFLRAAGCARAQGFLFSKAVAADEVPVFLQRWNRRKQGRKLQLVRAI